jgi:beta-1,4-mannosyltransferase
MGDLTVMAWPARRNSEENPYNFRLYSALEARSVRVVEFSPRDAMLVHFDILHMHWPDALLKNVSTGLAAARLFGLAAVLFVVKAFRRKKVVWTVHNLSPHNGAHPFVISALHTVLNLCVDGYMLFSQQSTKELREIHSRAVKKPCVLIDHGTYVEDYKPNESRAKTLRRYGISPESFVIGHFGTIDKYKGPLELTRAFQRMEDCHVRLIIAGRCEDVGLQAILEEAVCADHRIVLKLGWLSNEELGNLVQASDLVAYPYSRILNSGSVFLALSQRRPVLVPGTATFHDLAKSMGEGWVKLFSPPLVPSQLHAAVDDDPPREYPNLASRGWASIAEKTHQFYLTMWMPDSSDSTELEGDQRNLSPADDRRT